MLGEWMVVTVILAIDGVMAQEPSRRPNRNDDLSYFRKKFRPNELIYADSFCRKLSLVCPYLSSRTARPAPKTDDRVEISVDFTLIAFLGLDDLNQRFSIVGEIFVFWAMPRCACWNETVERVNHCFFSKNNMWHPHMKHLNRLSDKTRFDREGSDMIMVLSDQSFSIAIWEVIGMFDSSCQMAFQKFPFDRQTCKMAIGFRGMESLFTQFAHISNMKFMIRPDIFSSTEMWHLDDYFVEIYNDTQLDFNFVLRRKPECYVGKVFLSITTLTVMPPFSLFIPAAEANRSIFCVTVFLAVYVFLDFVTASLPTTSELMYVVVIVIVIMSTSMLLTIYSLISCTLALGPLKGHSTRFFRYSVKTIGLIDVIIFAISLTSNVFVNLAIFMIMAS